MSQDTLRALDRLLTREKQSLLAGDLSGIEDFAQQKARLAAGLSADLPAAHLKQVEEKLRYNATLLSAAAEGLKSGASRLRALATPPSLSTYGLSGQRRDLTPPLGVLTRRS